jgi:sugar/nucleoside kinase (ribokinase family)
MEEKTIDVFGIGSALMDIIIEVDDRTLMDFKLNKGEMILIEQDQAKEMLDKISHLPMQNFPGGSVSNTIAGIANLGGIGAFFGKIGDDKHGDLYETILEKEGIKGNMVKSDSFQTGHAITFITPDKERSFATHLGAAVNLKKPDFIDEDLKRSKILHLEAYQLEAPEIKELILHAVEIAKENNVQVSIDLNDAGLIKRNLEAFKTFVQDHVDIVFANDSEAEAFTELDDPEGALHEIAEMCHIACVKLGDQGSFIKTDIDFFKIEPFSTNPISSTGAGDMYAAGILYGITHALPLPEAGKIASYAAAKVVAQMPARLNEKVDISSIQ